MEPRHGQKTRGDRLEIPPRMVREIFWARDRPRGSSLLPAPLRDPDPIWRMGRVGRLCVWRCRLRACCPDVRAVGIESKVAAETRGAAAQFFPQRTPSVGG